MPHPLLTFITSLVEKTHFFPEQLPFDNEKEGSCSEIIYYYFCAAFALFKNKRAVPTSTGWIS